MIEQPTMREQRYADQADHASNAADDDRHDLFEAVVDANKVEHPNWGEQPDEVADENHEYANVEQVRAPHQLTPPQELARPRLPRVLLALEAQQAAEQKHRQP